MTSPSLAEFLLARIAEDQRRALAECAAKRATVQRSISNTGITVADDWPLAIMADVYADHPDYRQEWAS